MQHRSMTTLPMAIRLAGQSGGRGSAESINNQLLSPREEGLSATCLCIKEPQSDRRPVSPIFTLHPLPFTFQNTLHSGFALLTAMWVLVILMITVAGFAVLAHSEVEVVNNYADRASARWAAHAGIRDAEAQVMTLTANPYTELGGGSQLVTTGPTSTGALGNATYTLTIQDEAAKVNINIATATLLGNFFDTDVASNIITWRSESTANVGGADDAYYAGLTPPYHCKYAPFDTIDELLLVKGVGDVTPSPLDTVTADGLPLRNYLTTSSFDNNTTINGAPRINVNTASATVLATLFGIPPNAVPTRRALTSPADVLSWQGVTNSKLAAVYDRLTISTASTLPGLVNINTAPAGVLAALPGMDAATAAAIIQYRSTNGQFTDVGQLLTLTGMTATIFRAVAASLTVRSTVFRVFSTGQSADGLTASVSCVMRVLPSSGATGTSTSSSTSASTTTSTSILTTYWKEE